MITAPSDEKIEDAIDEGVNSVTFTKDEIFQMFLDVLRDAFDIDPGAFMKLVAHRVDCEPSLVDHPTIVVAGDDERPTLGMFGIINGICTRITGRTLAFKCEDDGYRITGFCEFTKPQQPSA